MPWQFRVIDGGDQGRIFSLPESGMVTLGSSRKHAEICLNDLYVVRVHAEVDIDGDRLVLTAHDSPSGTLLNGQKIRQEEIHHGDVVRLGNSHLRLEDAGTAAEEAPAEEEDIPEVEVEVLTEDEASAPAPAVEVPASPSVAAGDVAAVADEGAVAPVQGPAFSGTRLEDLPGHSLAHFQVEEVIGKGHAGIVFQARDLKKDRLVALKVLSADFPQGAEEMRRYAEVIKTILPLRHPNLVSLYSAGKTGRLCWLASEFVESLPLPEVIDRLSRVPKVDWQRSYGVAVQIGRALAFAHQHHVLHGNITARHILWRTSDKVAKLTDLGLADALSGSALKKKIASAKSGTELAYLAPEQTRPKAHLDHLTDLYALGVVLYALLTGVYPFVGSSEADTIAKILDEEPIGPTEWHEEIPSRFENIVLKMLAKRPEDRYQTAEALLADLQVVGQEQGVVV